MRMANEVACESTARDFHLPVERRLLFPMVEVGDAPETEEGDAVPAAVERIKNTIRHLHGHVLGEELAADDPELARTYQLFYETWQEGNAKTDEASLARPIDPGSLAVDNGGVKITPELVHLALRRVAGVADSELSTRYALPGETAALFG